MSTLHLTNYTDYALRTLVFLGTRPENSLTYIKEISDVYKISKNHVSKVVYELGQMGLIETIQGRNGGIRLAVAPNTINIGKIVRKTENLAVVECFNHSTNTCIISPICKLKHALYDAVEAYLKVLESYTLADVIHNQTQLQAVFNSQYKNK